MVGVGGLPVLLRRLCRLSGLRKVHVSRNRDTDAENKFLDPAGEREGGTDWERSAAIYTAPRVRWMEGGKQLGSTGSSARCCDDLGGWDEGWVGERLRGGCCMYTCS